MRVLLPSALLSYTGEPWVVATGRTVDAVLADLERCYPGIRFRMIDEQGRIRRHIRIFYQSEMIFDLATSVAADGELLIVQALSGG
jgi:hypothetical protein